MSLTKRQQDIASAILEVLDQTREYTMPETALRPQVNLQVRPLVMTFEFETILGVMEGYKWIMCPNPEEPNNRRWHIADMGDVKLRQWKGA